MQAVISVLLMATAIYVPLNIPIGGGLFVPNGPLFLLGLWAMFHARQLIGVVGAAGVALAYLLVNVALSRHDVASPGERFLSGMQLVYCVGTCGCVAVARFRERGYAARVELGMTVLTVLVLVLAFLETRTALGRFSDAFRNRFIAERQLYTADQRDLQIAGRIRPKVFTQEPSHAAWGMGVFALLALAHGRRPLLQAVCAVSLLLGGVVFYSPVLPAVLACWLLLWGLRRVDVAKDPKKLVTAAIAASVLVAGVVAVAVVILGQRVERLESLRSDTSIFVRLIQPFDLAATALGENPWFGVGFGGLEQIWYTIERIEGGADEVDLSKTVGSALLTVPLFGGLTGMALFAYGCARVSRGLRPILRMMALGVFVFALLQKQSIVITPAWIIGAVWYQRLREQQESEDVTAGVQAAPPQPEGGAPRLRPAAVA